MIKQKALSFWWQIYLNGKKIPSNANKSIYNYFLELATRSPNVQTNKDQTYVYFDRRRNFPLKSFIEVCSQFKQERIRLSPNVILIWIKIRDIIYRE